MLGGRRVCWLVVGGRVHGRWWVVMGGRRRVVAPCRRGIGRRAGSRGPGRGPGPQARIADPGPVRGLGRGSGKVPGLGRGPSRAQGRRSGRGWRLPGAPVVVLTPRRSSSVEGCAGDARLEGSRGARGVDGGLGFQGATWGPGRSRAGRRLAGSRGPGVDLLFRGDLHSRPPKFKGVPRGRGAPRGPRGEPRGEPRGTPRTRNFESRGAPRRLTRLYYEAGICSCSPEEAGGPPRFENPCF